MESKLQYPGNGTIVLDSEKAGPFHAWEGVSLHTIRETNKSVVDPVRNIPSPVPPNSGSRRRSSARNGLSNSPENRTSCLLRRLSGKLKGAALFRYLQTGTKVCFDTYCCHPPHVPPSITVSNFHQNFKIYTLRCVFYIPMMNRCTCMWTKTESQTDIFQALYIFLHSSF